MTQAGSIEISDVQKQFDELSIWDQKKFILKNLDNFDFEPKDVVDLTEWVNSPEDAVEKWGAGDLMDEMWDGDIEDYVTSRWFSMSNAGILELLEQMVEDVKEPGKRLMQQLLDTIEPWVTKYCTVGIKVKDDTK